ncbi:hypothetical protein PAM7066_01947 [Palleronia marisminoris]|uniref:Uncharacterized protein n=1 Tax=Palleronia marisminoris TaxID=315423 RepID=A0A1Y5SMC7_9RHOB|nr:hypothetical protein PAM7066_01947 [Palleronia marisminoris]
MIAPLTISVAVLIRQRPQTLAGLMDSFATLQVPVFSGAKPCG